MRSLTTSELLEVWEQGLDKPLLEKILMLLSKACGVSDPSELGKLSIGERDARLLLLREWMFGTQMQYVAHCPNCNEKVEWESNTKQLLLQSVTKEISVKTYSFAASGYDIKFRLLNSNDVAEIDAKQTGNNTEQDLLKQCILEVKHKKKSIPFEKMPQSIADETVKKMAEIDPQADVTMKLECPSCKNAWTARFDIMSFLWTEINSWAGRTMNEIFLLAKAFGWSENEILSLTPRRRQLYLQMIAT